MSILGFSELFSPSIKEIRAIPGLYISNRLAASSLDILRQYGITHILSVLNEYDLVRPSNNDDEGWTDFEARVMRKQVGVEDSPTEDILVHLAGVCEWIDKALKTSAGGGESNSGAKVLVHCRQGISRSGAVVVGYLMRRFEVGYDEALAMARESRDLITPNVGFEEQLRVWEQCGYDVYLPDLSEKAGDGEVPVGTGGRKEKAAYKLWKKEQQSRIAGADGVERVRISAVGHMAAEFGARRMALKARDEGRGQVVRTERKGADGSGGRSGDAPEGVGMDVDKTGEQRERARAQWKKIRERTDM